MSQLPCKGGCRLNCLSAGSVSLTATGGESRLIPIRASQLPFGWVCFSNGDDGGGGRQALVRLNCLSAGSVSLTVAAAGQATGGESRRLNCLSAGSVSLTLPVVEAG